MTALAHTDGRLLGSGGRAFTDEQTAAVERRDGPLLLSASAGSGKTSVLVERFVRSVVEDDLRPAQVLAITFTDKAAGELRSRVRSRLLELGERERARDTEAAWIMTFHGFCARVLRAHAVAAGLDPAFAVLDEPGARALRREAFDAALAGFLADRPDGASRADALDVAAAYTPDRLAEMVGDAHDTLRSRGQTRPVLPLTGAVDLSAARTELEAAAQGAAAALRGARGLVTIERARVAIAACLATLDTLPAAEAATAAALKAAAFSAGSVAELQETPAARYLDALAAFSAACRDARARPVLALLDELLGRFADAYAAAKRERSTVDFDDLELLTRDLLAGAPAAAASYAERFARIMVDEFQDTNPLQLEILGFLDRDNVFTVGDELQSIYGFRHADVGVFRARRADLAAHGATATLATSFRARPEILETIDAAFGDAHGDSWVALRPGRDDAADDEPRVELLLTDASAWAGTSAPELSDGLPAAPAARHAEARLVAQRIVELVRDGEADAGDIVVLLRAATDIGLYERAIEQEGLATLATGGRGWWGRRQVQDLCCYLGALANPRDEAALLGLLASPLVGASSDALALLAMAARERRGALWDALDDPATRVPAADHERLRAFHAWFGPERERAPGLGLDELLGRVVERTGYDLHVLALPGGARRMANINKLRRLAAAFEARRGRDVRGFIDLATAELEADAREPDAPVDLGDLEAVRLMTIHAAKGLEFPVVIVGDLGRRGATRQPDLLVEGDRVGLRLVSVENTREKALAWEAIADARRAAEEAEDRRVMHVAVTRAEERLILSGAVEMEKGWPSPGPAAAPLSWMGPALLPDLGVLSPATPETVREWTADGHPGRLRAALNAPQTLGRVLRLGPGAPGEQLTLALGDAAEVPLEPSPDLALAAAPFPMLETLPGELAAAPRPPRRGRRARDAQLLVPHALRRVPVPLPPRAPSRPARGRAAAAPARGGRARGRARPARPRLARARVARGPRARRAGAGGGNGASDRGDVRGRVVARGRRRPARDGRGVRGERPQRSSRRRPGRAPRALVRVPAHGRRAARQRRRRRARGGGGRDGARRRLQVRPRRRRRSRGAGRGVLRRPAPDLRPRMSARGRARRRGRPHLPRAGGRARGPPLRPGRRRRARARPARPRGRAACRRVPRRGRPAPRAVRRLPRPGGSLFVPAGPHGPARRGRRGRPLVRLSVSAHASCPSIWSLVSGECGRPKR